MALNINTNIASMTAQRNLGKTSLAMSRSLERLSSGLRINSARDDAAGLAISDRMTAQIRGLNQASRNANDGISVAQTAEGALQEMTNVLQRIRELAVQSANTTNTSDDRASLNQEVQQLISEYDRIASQTEFNGQKVLTGDFSGSFQVGSDVGQTMALTIDNVQGDNVGTASNFTGIDTELRTSGFSDFSLRMVQQNENIFTSYTINGTSVGDVSLATGHNNSAAKVSAINAVSATTGVSAFTVGNAHIGATESSFGSATTAGDIVINGVEIDAGASHAGVVSAINAKTSDTGVTAKTETTNAGTFMVLSNTTGAAITVRANTTDAQSVMGMTSTTSTVAAGANGAIVFSNDVDGTTLTFNDSSMALAVGETASLTLSLTAEKVSGLSVATAHGANLTIVAADQALQTIDNTRSKLGAVQNRLESTISNLQSVAENLSSARSRILDADIALETAGMTRNSILQQAGTAILAQANQQPQLALQLLA